MSSHTPGPWDAYYVNDHGLWCVVKADNGRTIDPTPANSHVISAAPEMYEALEAFDKWWRLPNAERTIEAIEPAMRMCIEAKAKAEGRKE